MLDTPLFQMLGIQASPTTGASKHTPIHNRQLSKTKGPAVKLEQIDTGNFEVCSFHTNYILVMHISISHFELPVNLDSKHFLYSQIP